MEYQLVLQFDTTNIDDFEALIEIEESIRQTLEPHQIVDGHDFGKNEMNIFIHTDYPSFGFKVSTKVIPDQYFKKMKAAYRRMNEENYTQIHPAAGTSKFSIALSSRTIEGASNRRYAPSLSVRIPNRRRTVVE